MITEEFKSAKLVSPLLVADNAADTAQITLIKRNANDQLEIGSSGLPLYIQAQISSDPGSNLAAGQLYYSTSSNKFRFYDGSVWADLGSGGGGTYTAGNGIDITSNVVSVKLDGATLSESVTGLKVATGGISNNEIGSAAAIAYSKLALTGSIVNADVSATAAIAYSKLALSASIVNADISATAAIAYSKLALTGSIVDADISASAAIAYSKLALSASIVNADISATAAIAYSKLALSASIVNADISASAAIAYSKLAGLGGSTNAVLIQDAGGHVSASSILSTNLLLADGTVSMTGALNMNSHQINNVTNPSSAQDVATKAYVDSLTTGMTWLSPLVDPDLVDDSLNTPPGSPTTSTTYIAGASPTGAWSGFAGYAFTWNGTTWVDLLGRAVAVGDRFGVTMEHGSGSEGGGVTGQHNKIAQITTATPGSIAYTFTTPASTNAIFVNNENSLHFGHSYVYTTSWIEFGGPSTTPVGTALAYSGNTLNVLVDGTSITTNGSNQLKFTGSIGTIDSQSASANGLVLVGSTIYAQSASGSNPGMVNTTSQTFTGAKTFSTSASSHTFIMTGSTSGSLTHTTPATITTYSVIWPSAQGTGSLTNDGAGNLSWVSGGGGGVSSINTLSGAVTLSTDATLALTTVSQNIQVGISAEYNAGTSTSSTTINYNNGVSQLVTLGVATTTFTFSNGVPGASHILRLVQDSSGNRAVTWPSSVKWPSGAPVSLTTSANAVDLVNFYYDGTYYYGTYGLNFQ